jgi:hypothetical protein
VRRNLTISFDEEFIVKMDNARGAWSRGVYVEELFADQQGLVGPCPSILAEIRSGIKPSPKPDKRPNPMPVKPPESVTPKLRIRGVKPRPKRKKN